MTEEPNKKEEKALSILEQAKAEREAVEKANEEARKLIGELKEQRAEDILSGRAEQSPVAAKTEVSNADYARQALQGIVPKK